MSIAKIKMAGNLQVKFSHYINYYTDNLRKTTQRFIKEVSLGIIKTQSCIVRRIAQQLDEGIDLKKVQERLSYQLDKREELSKFKENLLKASSNRLEKNSLIIVDPSDIIKKKAKKMEGLSKVRDGSDGKYKNGYEVIDIIGVDSISSQFSLFPIYSEVHSEKIFKK